MKKVFFYYDFISPYTYLACSQISAITQKTNCELIFKPTLFAGLLSHHHNLGPAEIPAKREYVFKDTFRLCHQLNLPIKGPPTHPFLSLIPLRLCMATTSETDLQKLTGILVQACWGEGMDITDFDTLQKLIEKAKISTDGLLERFQSTKIKQALKANGQEATDKGVFGVPTFSVDQELFWGHDRIPLLIEYLNGNYFIDEKEIQKALDRPRSADRKEYLTTSN